MLFIFSHRIPCGHADEKGCLGTVTLPVMGNVRTWKCIPFPQSLHIFRAAKRRLGSAKTPEMNKCSGVKPLPGKLPKGQ